MLVVFLIIGTRMGYICDRGLGISPDHGRRHQASLKDYTRRHEIKEIVGKTEDKQRSLSSKGSG